MKKLKNIVTGISLILMMFMSFSVRAQELSELSKDETFVSYVKDQLEFNKNNNIELVNELASQGELSEKQLELFYKAFNTNDERYNKFVKLQNNRMLVLNEKYNLESVSINELTPIVGLVIDQISPGSANQTEGGNCWRRYRNTMAINAGVAVAAHIACAPSDVTVFIGALCHTAVTVVWAAANDDAWLDLQDCLK